MIAIDYLSDTITKPDREMLDAMMSAKVGDDAYGEDETVNDLETLAAEMLGKKAACFTPSGTMANLAAILAHCPRGYEALVGDQSDVYLFEAGGPSVLGGVVCKPIATNHDGTLSIDALGLAVHDGSSYQCSRSRLICIENPHNLRGGMVLPLSYLQNLRDFAKERQLKLHMDGARIFNAAIALGVNASEIACYVDSVQCCLSKSLSAPIGSIIAGEAEFITEVRRLRKMLGGGMRQAGYVAAAGIVALKHRVLRLGEDHARAQRLAHGISNIRRLVCNPEFVKTNLVYFGMAADDASVGEFLGQLLQNGIRMTELGYRRIRAAIHRHITDEDISVTLEVLQKISKNF